MTQTPQQSSQGHCNRCRFWLRLDAGNGADLGQCRRYPPFYEGWPMTLDASWCGEWQPGGDPARPMA